MFFNYVSVLMILWRNFLAVDKNDERSKLFEFILNFFGARDLSKTEEELRSVAIDSEFA